MSGHEVRPAPYSDRPLGAGSAREALPERGLGARYVAVRHSASFFEARAKFWRRWCLIGWGLALGAHLALVVVIFR